MTKISKVRKSSKYNWFYLAKVGEEKVFKASYNAIYLKIYRWQDDSKFEIMPGSIDNKVIVKRVS